MARLDGRTALVTGGAGGLGEAICRRLAEEGAWVAVADLNEDKGVRLARALGKSALFVKLDVTQEDQWQAAVDTLAAQFGGLDILVNGAGILPVGTIEEATLAEWQRGMAINGGGVFLGCKYGVAAMKNRAADQPWASIINISSAAVMRTSPANTIYAATKAAVRALTKPVALHCATMGYHIRVNTLLPGGVPTDMLSQVRPANLSEADYTVWLTERHPIGRLGTPREIADAVVFLASDESAFMTGADLTVDGGMTI